MACATGNLYDLVGKPFELGARGPDKFDCFGLVIEAYRRSGILIPEVVSPKVFSEIATVMTVSVPLFKTVSEPVPGVIVGLRTSGRYMTHVGILIRPDYMIHTWEKSGGVCVERLSLGPWANRIVGYYDFAK